VQLLYVGRLVRTKGARDLIRAMSRLRDVPVRLTIAGDGFDRAQCERLLDELSLRDVVTLLGRVPHAAVADLYRAADAFVFPSYREPGGIVVTEAMSFGLPLVVSDRGGPGHTVDEASGIRVPIRGTPEQYADDIAAAVRRLVESPSLRASMGMAARERIAEVALWDRKIARLQELYDEVLATARR
jgi:glycosyltransferase involved in cell wall biosynthesis